MPKELKDNHGNIHAMSFPLQQEMKWKHYTYRVSPQLGRCLLCPSGGCDYPLNEQETSGILPSPCM